MKWRSCLISFLVLSSLCFNAQGQSVKLKYAHFFTPEDFRGKTAQYFAESLQTESNGSIAVQVFPAQQLVKGTEGFQATAQGVADLYPVPTSYMAGQFPLGEIFNLPFPPPKYNDAAMLNIYKDIKPILENEFAKNNLKLIGLINTTGPVYLFLAKPLLSLDDLKGVKIRGPGGMVDRGLTKVGAAITFLSSAEQYMALQTGTVDGMITNCSTFISLRLYEVARYLLRVTVSDMPYFLLMNKPKWDALNSKNQRLLIKAAEETSKWSLENYRAEEERSEAAVKGKIQKVFVLSPEQWKKWHDLVRPLYDEWVANNGDNGKRIMESFNRWTKP